MLLVFCIVIDCFDAAFSLTLHAGEAVLFVNGILPVFILHSFGGTYFFAYSAVNTYVLIDIDTAFGF